MQDWMSIDNNEDIDDNKVEEIIKIVYSLFEDETLTYFFIKTVALSFLLRSLKTYIFSQETVVMVKVWLWDFYQTN